LVHGDYGSPKRSSPARESCSSVLVSSGLSAPTKHSAAEAGDRQLCEYVWRQFPLMDNSQDIIIQAKRADGMKPI